MHLPPSFNFPTPLPAPSANVCNRRCAYRPPSYPPPAPRSSPALCSLAARLLLLPAAAPAAARVVGPRRSRRHRLRTVRGLAIGRSRRLISLLLDNRGRLVAALVAPARRSTAGKVRRGAAVGGRGVGRAIAPATPSAGSESRSERPIGVGVNEIDEIEPRSEINEKRKLGGKKLRLQLLREREARKRNRPPMARLRSRLFVVKHQRREEHCCDEAFISCTFRAIESGEMP